jgi:hypothetical protein
VDPVERSIDDQFFECLAVPSHTGDLIFLALVVAMQPA